MMIRRNALLPVVGVSLLLTAPANADSGFVTIGSLRETCKNVDNVSSGHGEPGHPTNMALLCAGYLAGMMNAMNYYSTVLGVKEICVPADVDVRQGIGIFMKWANDHPEDWHHAASNGVFEALGEPYRCGKK